jgi:hypothetical protein
MPAITTAAEMLTNDAERESAWVFFAAPVRCGLQRISARFLFTRPSRTVGATSHSDIHDSTRGRRRMPGG